MAKKTNILSIIAIFCIPLFYGGFYSVTKFAIEDTPIFWINTFRLIIALLCLAPYWKRLLKLKKNMLKGNILISLAWFLGLASQSFALKTATASNTGFLVAFSLIFTPLINYVLYRKKMSGLMIVPIICSIIGFVIMYHLFDSPDIELDLGVWLGLLGALAISIHLVFTGHYIQENDAVVFTLMQIIFGLILSGVSALIFEPNLEIANISSRSWFSFLYLGIACTVLTFNFQNWGQKYVNAMVVSLIVALEPIFATIFGVILINESIDTNFIIGGIFILLGAFLAILFQTKSEKSLTNIDNGE